MARISSRMLADESRCVADLLPSVDQTLLDHLKHQFRVDICPGIELRQIDRMIGWKDVINHLELLLVDQNQDK